MAALEFNNYDIILRFERKFLPQEIESETKAVRA